MTREERHIAVLSRLLENMDVYDSVQPTEERKKAIKAAIKALSQEPCDDVVSRQAVIKLFNGNIGSESALILHKVKQLPSVTPSRSKGQWIKKGNTLICPICKAKGEDIEDYHCFNYCPNCGAELD